MSIFEETHYHDLSPNRAQPKIRSNIRHLTLGLPWQVEVPWQVSVPGRGDGAMHVDGLLCSRPGAQVLSWRKRLKGAESIILAVANDIVSLLIGSAYAAQEKAFSPSQRVA